MEMIVINKKNKLILKNMNIQILGIIFFMLLVNIPLSSAGTANILLNPGFENGTAKPLNWNLVTVGSNTPIWDTISHTGARSIKVSVPGTSNFQSGYPQSDIITALPLQNYTFSVWVKTLNAGGDSSPTVRVVELDNNKNWIRQTPLYFNRGTNNWANKQITFQTTINTKYLYAYANIWNGYGSFWMDDLILTAPISTPIPMPTPTPTPTPTPVPAPIPIGNIYYVAKTGNNNNPGTDAQPWLTISKAASTMVAGDTVYVKAGTYNEQVRITKTGTPGKYITYATYPGDENKVIIDGTGFDYSWDSTIGGASGPVLIEANYINFTGFRVINSNGVGIKAINGLTNIILYKNWVANTASMCISFRGNLNGNRDIKDIMIDGNDVSYCNSISYGFTNTYGEFIELNRVDTFTIKNNIVHDWIGDPTRGGEGIDTTNSINGAIHHNEIFNVKLGIYVDAYQGQDSNIDVYGNLVHDTTANGIEVAAEEGGSLGGYIKNIRIYNNVVYNPGGNAFGISACCGSPSPITDITIHSNTFRGGVWIGHANGINNIILRNNIADDISVDSGIPASVVIQQNNIMTGSSYPGFINEAGHNYHLTSTASAKDTGTAIGAPAFDFDGKSRPQGLGYDIGAFEY